MLTTIWQRYLFNELFKVFCFFLVAFFFLYSLIDYSTHMQDFMSNGTVQLKEILFFYGFQFIKRAVLLLPLALLIATIKVLCTLNATRELVALQASGLNLKTLLRPFFLLAGLCCVFNWFSAEKLLPAALNTLESFEDKHHYNSHSKHDPFHVLHLKDNSKLVYQKHDIANNILFDVYWIRSFNDIWRIKTLKDDPKDPVADFADHLVRKKDGTLAKVESFDKCRLNELKWQSNMPRKGMIPIEGRKVSQLIKVLFHKEQITKTQASEALTYVGYKLTMPLLSLLVVIAVAPFCIRYTRNVPTFFIYSMGLFGFIAFFTLLDACIILGSHRTIPPLLAILVPFGVCSAFFSWKFVKTS